MNSWLCYLIYTIEKNQTYIGATNNFKNRIKKHNSGKGAKRTKGNLWAPAILITGFTSKESCLSFESCWKRMCHRRSNKKLDLINLIKNSNYHYGKCSLENRFYDLMIYLWSNFFYHPLVVIPIVKMQLVLPANIIYSEEIIKIISEHHQVDFLIHKHF